MSLFNGKEIIWEAYEKGQVAYHIYNTTGERSPNPYIEYSDEWFSWNRGWNS